jgi:hypothetical protein
VKFVSPKPKADCINALLPVNQDLRRVHNGKNKMPEASERSKASHSNRPWLGFDGFLLRQKTTLNWLKLS